LPSRFLLQGGRAAGRRAPIIGNYIDIVKHIDNSGGRQEASVARRPASLRYV
jgi:hypothetical protein